MAVSLIEKTVYANPQLIADASDEALILSEF